MIAVFLMTSNPPITKAMPHHWTVYHQCLIHCGITDCSYCPAPLSSTSEWPPRQTCLTKADELCLPGFYIGVFLHLDRSVCPGSKCQFSFWVDYVKRLCELRLPWFGIRVFLLGTVSPWHLLYHLFTLAYLWQMNFFGTWLFAMEASRYGLKGYTSDWLID